jgi:hydroxymethylbilane synthase
VNPLRVLSRSSPLAKVQVEEAFAALREYWLEGAGSAQKLPFPTFDVHYLTSYGDRNKSISLLDGSAPGDLFTRELDESLLRGQADFAVHSAKDLNLPQSEGLVVLALLPARDPSDSLACQRKLGKIGFPDGLPRGARVGTSSPLRRSELLRLRPDLEIVPIRGTIEERLALVDSGQIDALIVATCALERLGLHDRISTVLPFETHPLQGHLAVTGLAQRGELRALWAPLDVRRNWGRVVVTTNRDLRPWGTRLVQDARAENRAEAEKEVRSGGVVVRRVSDSEQVRLEREFWESRLVDVQQDEPPTLAKTWYTGTDPARFWRSRGILHRPLIELFPLEPNPALDAALKELSNFAWVVLTSRPAVRFTLDRLEALKIVPPADLRWAAVGQATAAALAERGLAAELVATQEDAEGLVRELFPRLESGQKVLFPCSNLASTALQDGLSPHQVVRIEAYRNQRVEVFPQVDLSGVEEILVASPSCARALAQGFKALLPTVLLTPLGKPTARVLSELFPGVRLGPAVLDSQRASASLTAQGAKDV